MNQAMKQLRIIEPFKWISGSLFLLCCTLWSLPGMEGFKFQQDFTKTINKEFVVSDNAEIELSNRYGEINIETWNQKSVKLDIRIVVQTNSQKDAEEVFNRIDVDFYNSASRVSASTTIDNTNPTNWWDRIFRGQSKDDFKIYYDVKMPQSASLNTVAKYCDVKVVGTIDGTTELEVKYGDFNFDEVNNDVKVELAYGDGAFKSVKNLDLSLRYGEMDIDRAEEVELDTRYSEVKIDAFKRADIDSRYDDFVFGNVERLNIDAGYSDFRLKNAETIIMDANYTDLRMDELSGKLVIDLDYGDLAIESLKPGFSSLEIEGSYSDFVIGIGNNVGFGLDVESRYTSVSYPKSRMEINYLVEQGRSKTIRGKTKAEGGGTIKARLGYGSLKIYD